MEDHAEAQVRDAICRMEEAWNRHDAKAFAEVFAEDADFINVQGSMVHGRDEIEKLHAATLSSMFQHSRICITNTRICTLTPEVIQADIQWRMTNALDEQGAPCPSKRGLLMVILMQERGRWVIKILHNIDLTNIPPDNPPTLL